MDIPMNLATEYARQALADTINHCLQVLKVPPFVMEFIIKDMHQEMTSLAKHILDEANTAYQQAQQKEVSKTTKSEIQEAE